MYPGHNPAGGGQGYAPPVIYQQQQPGQQPGQYQYPGAPPAGAPYSNPPPYQYGAPPQGQQQQQQQQAGGPHAPSSQPLPYGAQAPSTQPSPYGAQAPSSQPLPYGAQAPSTQPSPYGAPAPYSFQPPGSAPMSAPSPYGAPAPFAPPASAPQNPPSYQPPYQPPGSAPPTSSPYQAPPSSAPLPYGAPPQGQAPYGAPPQGQAPYGAPPQGQATYGAPPQGQAPYGAPPQGQTAYGAPPQGQAPYGAPPQGQTAYGAPPQGQAPYGNPPPGQAPYGATPQGQAPYGAPPQGQTPYGAPPQGQAPYGAPPQGQAPYGTTPPYQQAYTTTPQGAPQFGQAPPGAAPAAAAAAASAAAAAAAGAAAAMTAVTAQGPRPQQYGAPPQGQASYGAPAPYQPPGAPPAYQQPGAPAPYQPPTTYQPSPAPSQGRKKALLVGCSYPGSSGALRGCINDVQCIKYCIQKHFAFPEANIVVLRDDIAHPDFMSTRKNIMQGIQWLVGDNRPGDSLFFHYSGHGSQTADLDGDEDDGYDETILPTDHSKAGQITDDQLNLALVRPLVTGARLHAVIDACHSGTALDLSFRTVTDRSTGRILFKGKPNPNKNTSGGWAVQFGACKDSQTAADTNKMSGSAFTGAATFSFIQAIESYPQQNQTYATVVEHMAEQLRKMSQGSGPSLPQGGGGLTGMLTGLLNEVLSGGSGQSPKLSSNVQFDLYRQPFVI